MNFKFERVFSRYFSTFYSSNNLPKNLSCNCIRSSKSSISRLRSYSSTKTATVTPSKPSHLNVFDRQCKFVQRERSLLMDKHEQFDYIKEEAGFILADRVRDIKRNFDYVLDLGCGKGYVLQHFSRRNIGSIIASDSSPAYLSIVKPPMDDVPCQKLLMDEENIILKNNMFNLVVSNLNLHWVNNLPKTFRKVHDILKPDGAFLGSMFGCQTLYELRCSLQLTEMEREGGMGSHISPFAEINDIGGLLSINGFTMLTLDVQEFRICYPSIFELMEDLKGMSENNASWKRNIRINRDTLFAAASIYKEMYGNEDGSIPATYQVIFFIAWKPDPSQPKPLKQQTPQFSLKDLDKLK